MIEYHATTDVKDPNVVWFFEQYEDAEAFEETVPDLLAGGPDVLRFDVDEAPELEL